MRLPEVVKQAVVDAVLEHYRTETQNFLSLLQTIEKNSYRDFPEQWNEIRQQRVEYDS